MKTDTEYMARALKLARRADGMTSPNPCVGAVVVRKNRIVGSGYHRKAGTTHAEKIALDEAGSRARGATLYVTLEPCDHYGRTPPCTEMIIRSGIQEVVIAMIDPNPTNRGSGVRRLKKSGIRVDSGILRDEAEALNRPYIKFITKKIPFVTLKMAQSLDGKIASRTGDSRWITGERSRKTAHGLRAKADAIAVGVGTVLKDDPLLTVRGARKRSEKIPVRVVVDSSLRTPLNSRIVRTSKKYPVVIAVGTAAQKRKIEMFEKKGVSVIILPKKGAGLSLRALLRELAQRGVMHLLVEGGGELAASFIAERLVDRVRFYIAPKIVGGRDAVTSVEGDGVACVASAVPIRNMTVRRIGGDIVVDGEIE
ncbi:MAG: bifunctional diaminohydroxyphosphoribosylaminopyrimidine deaminase/5-amino-6-(5-phosphoribosylamino)uracil reductase RibD [Candidatus Omnitrophota bacterium]